MGKKCKAFSAADLMGPNPIAPQTTLGPKTHSSSPAYPFRHRTESPAYPLISPPPHRPLAGTVAKPPGFTHWDRRHPRGCSPATLPHSPAPPTSRRRHGIWIPRFLTEEEKIMAISQSRRCREHRGARLNPPRRGPRLHPPRPGALELHSRVSSDISHIL